MVRLFPGTGASDLPVNVTSRFTDQVIERYRLDRQTMPPPDRIPPDRIPPWRLRPRRLFRLPQPTPTQQQPQQPPPPQQLPQQPPPQLRPQPPPDLEEGYHEAAAIILQYIQHRFVCHPYVEALYHEALLRIEVICDVHAQCGLPL